MRPVNRGPWPVDAQGNALVFSPYGKARDALIERLGDYCSYCGVHILNPQVEHMSPKSLDPAREEDWDNFLLGCTWCNTIKGNKPLSNTLLWSDRDNTLRMVTVLSGGRLRINHRFKEPSKSRIQETVDLVGLLRQPGGAQRPSASDRRYIKRAEAWRVAVDIRRELEQDPGNEGWVRAAIETAKARGFFGIWFHVFRAHSTVLARLVDAFPGTDRDAFEAGTLKPKPRGEL